MERSHLFLEYKKKIPAIMKELNISNVMQVPELKKIVVNVGAGKAISDANYIKTAAEDISLITGQKPIITKAKTSESNFKLRQGVPIGLKVTLRKDRMYDFLYKLINLALPRVRDFEGLSFKSFDGRGNYTFGMNEHVVFYEIDFAKVTNVIGMDITFVTDADTDREAEVLLRQLGLPLKERK